MRGRGLCVQDCWRNMASILNLVHLNWADPQNQTNLWMVEVTAHLRVLEKSMFSKVFILNHKWSYYLYKHLNSLRANTKSTASINQHRARSWVIYRWILVVNYLIPSFQREKEKARGSVIIEVIIKAFCCLRGEESSIVAAKISNYLHVCDRLT